MFPSLVEVKPLPGYVLSLTFGDGTKGTISLEDLSTTDVFSAWKKNIDFNKVFIAHKNVIAWNEEMEIDAESLYLDIKGLTFEQWKEATQHAATK